MASNQKVAAARERKADRTHASQGQQRSHVAALQRQRQAAAEAARIEAANVALRAQRRAAPDPLDTSYQIERSGKVTPQGEEAGETPGAYIPFSWIDREGDEPDEDMNVAHARGDVGTIRVHTAPVLIGEGGVPAIRENVLERLDPSDRLMKRALQMFAQRGRSNPKLARRFNAVQIARENGEVAGRTKPSVATLSIIGRRMDVSRATAANYLREGRAYLQGCLDTAAEYERERA